MLSTGYNMTFIRTGFELDDKQILFNTFNESVTGLILMESLNGETYEYLRNQVPYIVGIDTERGDIDNVGYDHYNVASITVNHLIKKRSYSYWIYRGKRFYAQLERQPPLSTTDIPTKEIGMVAVDLLIDRINGNTLLPKKVILPTHLVLRSSS